LKTDGLPTPEPPRPADGGGGEDLGERARPDWGRALLTIFGLYALGFVGLAWLSPGSGFGRDLLRDSLGLPQSLLVAALCLRAASGPGLDSGTRRAWRLLALARLGYALGDLFWLYEGVTLRSHPPFSPASFFYLTHSPLVLSGLLSFPRVARSGREKVQFWLDAATVFLGGAMAWYYAIGPMGGDSFRTRTTALATIYLLGNLVLILGLAVTLLRQSDSATRPVFLLIGAGMLFELAADLLQGHFARVGRSDRDGPDALFMLNSFLVGLAAHLHFRRAGRALGPPSQAVSAPSVSLLPYFSVALGYGLLVAAVFCRRFELLNGLVACAVPLTAVVLARQLVAVRENMRLLARQAAQKSEARFAALVQNSSDVILLVDPSGVVRYETPSVERILEYPTSELAGTRLAELVEPNDELRLADLVGRAKARPGVTGPAEIRLRKKSGGWLFMEVTVTNLLDNPDLGGLVFTLRDVHERKLLEERLSYQAFHDPLTGLANRALLADRLAHAIVVSRRVGRPLALLLLDLDNFKAVNDSLGHAAGDQVLVEVGRRTQSSVREGDTAARLGGDEFAVLLEDIDGEEMAVEVTTRLSRALRAPLNIDGNEVFVTASIGIVVTRDRGETASDMFRNADVAMYAAKRHDKGRFRLFEADMRQTALSRIELEADLRHALERAELVLHFQPMVRLATGVIVGGEALLRWQHPRRGLLSPGAFIPLAEETDLIVPIGRWVLEEACGYAAAWPAGSATEGALRVSVNLSGRQLQGPVLVDEVREALRTSGLPPERLILEVTESLPLLETPIMAARLRELRALGVSLAIDDFGTGYSSLSYLRLLPMDILKIDRSFVDGIEGEGRGSPLLRGIVDLAKAMQLKVTAEGIETEAQAVALREFGCDFAQGFLFARPLEAEAFRLLIEGNERLPVGGGTRFSSPP
jgi:diguanylate cyclase (GGDEF)-like protein/PAS domain S-box-containing protein